MIKHFCDRCGKEVTHKTNYSMTVVLRSKEISDKDMVHPRIENVMCKDCVNALLIFMENSDEQRARKLPCKIGDPLYWISPEDDEGNEIDTVKQYDGGVASFVISAEGIRVADKDATREILRWSQEIGTEYAYLTREEAEAALRELRELEGELRE